jgi:DNA-binding NarL/FixJ family response regulator
MRTEYRFLLIGASADDPWQQVIEATARPFGSLCTAVEDEALRLIRQHPYDVVIIDAAKVEDMYQLIAMIRTGQPEAKIVVATMSPTWKRAREAFRVGATDYVRKSMNEAENRLLLEASLGKTPPASSSE